jgi:hypothetical protein
MVNQQIKIVVELTVMFLCFVVAMAIEIFCF